MNPKTIRAKHARSIGIEIDHRGVTCPEGVSVLRAAEMNGVYVPSLCSHKDLSPFGGCRLCMVEIEGMRGYPMACSTIVQEGMKVLTDTVALREMRKEILELILSEHPSSCLVCTEKDECKENQYTIRKAGVSTGCRSCPNDGGCELQNVVERLGVTDIHYPVYYHGYEPGHDDPFFDRDYNICILCGRCVRMCQEVRGAGVLAFTHRGPKTVIGTAFGRSHVEAGCEFCGACVGVCPTGALTDKVSKWDGQPDGLQVSTCPFCALGCQLELKHRNGRLSRAEAHLDPEINDGQLCVRGRFCLPEVTHHHERAKKPVLKRGSYRREVDWSEALDDVAARLKGLAPDDFLMVVSPDLTNESLFVAQKFVRSILKSNGIDSTARSTFPGGIDLWAKLLSLPISIKEIAHADTIIAVGLDTRFYFSIVGVEVRRALREGARLVTIDSHDSNLARYADLWLRTRPGTEGTVLGLLADSLLGGSAPNAARIAGKTGVDREKLARALDAVAPGGAVAIVVGPSAFAADPEYRLAEALLRLAEREQTSFLPLFHGSNTRGVLELGAFPEILPGPRPAEGKGISLDDLLQGRATPKVLFLIGEAPFFERPSCEYIIAQDIYYPPFEVDAFLPASSFAEAEGTLTNVEGRVQENARIEDLPDGALTGCARPDWLILGMLAERLSRSDLLFESAARVREQIHREVPGFPEEPDRRQRMLAETGIGSPAGRPAPARGDARADGRRLLVVPGGFRHRGIDLCGVVEGLSELSLEEGIRLHPEDLAELGIEGDGPVLLRADGIEIQATARADASCPPGSIIVHRPLACGGIPHRKDLEPLYRASGIREGVLVEPQATPEDSGVAGRGAGGLKAES